MSTWGCVITTGEQPSHWPQCSQRGSPSVLKEDRGGRRRVVPSGLFPNLPYHPPRTRDPAVSRGKCLIVAVPHHPPPSPTVPHVPLRQLLSYIVGPAILNNDGRPEISRTRTDRLLLSRPVQGSWQSPRRAPPGPRTVENITSASTCVSPPYFSPSTAISSSSPFPIAISNSASNAF